MKTGEPLWHDLGLMLYRYKIGDSFFSLPLPEVQELLSSSVEKIETEVTTLEEKISELQDEMQDLKTELYSRFGRSINLEA
jgi:prefoldin subunit 4